MLFFVLENSAFVLLGIKKWLFFYLQKEVARKVLVMIFCLNKNSNGFINKIKLK
jgi:hypothetical protein